MNEERTIRGATMMIWEDQVRCAVRPVMRVMAIFLAVMMGAFLIVWAINLPASEWLQFQREPAVALGQFVQDVWRIYLSCAAAMLVVSIGRYAWAFHRVPLANRQLAYEATSDGIVTRDGANFAYTLPWSSVVRVRNGDYMMNMRLTTGVWRMIFWRAFAVEDRE